ncbi:MAG TPA: hypothetical protein PKE47_12755, partial [Verrucomicrobiota bacterium]|nr:hypothetical protein [Verrucomicrobiota bacterium]
MSATAETVVTFPPEVLAARPELAGVELRVPPNALYADSGARGGRVGIAPVAPDRLPGVLPGGLEFPLVITVQTDGAMNFDEPVPVCFPNLPDPGLGVPLPPGEKNYLYSFNHDTGEWEAVGSMTVSADGTMICTDPGVGLLQPGWHGSGPAPSEPNPPGNCPGAPRPALAMQIANDLTSAACRQECRLECDIVRRNCEIVDTIQNCSIPVGACGGLGTIIGPLGTILGGAGCGIICGQINLWRCLSNYEDCHEICSLKTDCQQPPRCTVPGSPTGTPQPGPRVVALQAESGHQVLQNTFTDQDILNAFSHLETALGIEYNAALYERKLIESEILLIQTEIDSADQLFGGQLKEIISLYEMSRERVFSGNWAMPGNAPDYPIEYTAITHRAGSVNVIRSKTRRGGEFQLFLPRDAQLKSVIFFDRLQHRVGVVYPFVTNQRTLPRVTLVSADGLLDSDGDGLCDLAEFALGSRPANPDSDGDGLPDGVEVRNGTDPLDGRPVATGVIASQPLPGGALDVCAFDNRALVALGGPGVGVLNVFNGLNPTLIAQVDTPGSAHQVACAGNLVAVADGAAGVALVDITTPADAALVRQVPVNALGGGETRSVATAADLVFAGQSSCFLAVIEAATGVARGRMGDRAIDARIVALRFGDATIYRFMFVSPTEQTASMAPGFDATAASFRRLSAGEIPTLRP